MQLLYQIKNLSLSFPHKILFEDFSAQIYYGDRIALIGNNGTGKSMLLKVLMGAEEPESGRTIKIGNFAVGYVPQTVSEHDTLSGGERFNKALSLALAERPDLLLLDEPTNHLDGANRHSLMRMLRSYRGAVIAATHDESFIRECMNTIWHIDRGKINIFSGYYDNYTDERERQKDAVLEEARHLETERKAQHNALMQEQKRAKTSRASGEKKWDNKGVLKAELNEMKSVGRKTSGGRRSDIREKKEDLMERLKNLDRPEIIRPRFHLPHRIKSNGYVMQIDSGSIGYGDKIILNNIDLRLAAGVRLALTGDNGSGKTTLVRAILSDSAVTRGGQWYLPLAEDIGYLDQHYSDLDSGKTVYESVYGLNPSISEKDLRSHLHDFLFKKTEEVETLVKNLSGGEKARLALAKIALHTPVLLILDEITNNVDLITKRYLAQVIREYPGTLIVISHDVSFLDEINVTLWYSVAR